MPDLDIVERKLGATWRSVGRLIKGRQPANVVADESITAMAKQIRSEGGVHGFTVFAEALYQVPRPKARPGARLSRSQSVATIARKLEQRLPQRAPLLAHAFLQHQIRIEDCKALPSPEAFAKELLLKKLDHHLFSRIEPITVGDGRTFEDAGAFAAYKADVLALAETRLCEFARNIVKNPQNQKIRAPRRINRRLSTVEILDKPIF